MTRVDERKGRKQVEVFFWVLLSALKLQHLDLFEQHSESAQFNTTPSVDLTPSFKNIVCDSKHYTSNCWNNGTWLELEIPIGIGMPILWFLQKYICLPLAKKTQILTLFISGDLGKSQICDSFFVLSNSSKVSLQSLWSPSLVWLFSNNEQSQNQDCPSTCPDFIIHQLLITSILLSN